MKILKISTLEKGWANRDDLLLHASFQILVDFVERERPFEIIDWKQDQRHRDAAKEIRYLYRWWVKLRLQRHDPLDDLKEGERPSLEEQLKPIYESDGKTVSHYELTRQPEKYPKYHAALEKFWNLKKKWQDEDQANLIRLIKIRQFLWT